MGLQQMLENRLLGVQAFPKDPLQRTALTIGDHLSMTPTLAVFLELSRSVLNADNFVKTAACGMTCFKTPQKIQINRNLDPSVLINQSNQEYRSNN